MLKSLTLATVVAVVAATNADPQTAESQRPNPGTGEARRADRIDSTSSSPGRPTKAAESLKEELLFQRATQVYLWALPLINTLGMSTGRS